LKLQMNTYVKPIVFAIYIKEKFYLKLLFVKIISLKIIGYILIIRV